MGNNISIEGNFIGTQSYEPTAMPNHAYDFVSVPGSDLIGIRVEFKDYLGVKQSGTVIYAMPHKSEQDVYYLGIRLDREELNQIQITLPNNSGFIMVGEYIRSDRCWEL